MKPQGLWGSGHGWCLTQGAWVGMRRGQSAAEPASALLVGKGRGNSQQRDASPAAPAVVSGEGADTGLGWHKRWLHPCDMFLYYKLLCNKIRPLPN